MLEKTKILTIFINSGGCCISFLVELLKYICNETQIVQWCGFNPTAPFWWNFQCTMNQDALRCDNHTYSVVFSDVSYVSVDESMLWDFLVPIKYPIFDKNSIQTAMSLIHKGFKNFWHKYVYQLIRMIFRVDYDEKFYW